MAACMKLHERSFPINWNFFVVVVGRTLFIETSYSEMLYFI